MKKIVLLPLDERPCNAKFPSLLFDSPELTVVCPPKLGDKKEPAEYGALEAFLLEACRDADGLVLSMDMLLYGGLIPSRLHSLEQAETERRMELLRIIRRARPEMPVFAFHCIMRCPSYSSDDEEPDYYGRFGSDIHQLGVARHRMEKCEETAGQEAQALERRIPPQALEDYLTRRRRNLEMNLKALELAEDGTIDFLAVPQDDSAPLGFTAMDQAQVRLAVREKRLQRKVLIYPGADELGLTLTARMINRLYSRCPAVYPLYASEGAPFVIPPFEDRPLGETVRCQIAAAGCRPAASPEQADLILALSAPPVKMAGAAVQPRQDLDYDVCRSLTPFFLEMCFWMDRGKAVSICDNAYCNGGDLELLAMLDADGRMLEVAGYAGWNTSANTMGTALAEGVRYLLWGADSTFLDFLALRYVEDCGYDAVVRQAAAEEDLPGMGLDYFHAGSQDGEAAACVFRRLQAFIDASMPSVASRLRLKRVRLPWRRMFEADIEVQVILEPVFTGVERRLGGSFAALPR